LREQEKRNQEELKPDFIVAAGALLEGHAFVWLSVADKFKFNEFFGDIEKFLDKQDTFSEDPFKTILRNLYEPAEVSDLKSIASLPLVFLPGQLTFNVVDIDKHVLLINRALSAKHVLEKNQYL
jgi:hypothetical protein